MDVIQYQDPDGKIMVAVLTIGVIGFLLDRVMLALQALFTHRTTS